MKLFSWPRSWLRPKPVQPMLWGVIGIDQEQFVDLTKGTAATVAEADGGWSVEAATLARPIFVPFNQTFVFGRERILVQRSKQLEDILDRIDGIPVAASA